MTLLRYLLTIIRPSAANIEFRRSFIRHTRVLCCRYGGRNNQDTADRKKSKQFASGFQKSARASLETAVV
jgi:hypothetical protein